MIERQAWGVETILTCIFVIVVFAATDAQRAISTAHLPVSHREGVAVIGCQLHAVATDALVPSAVPTRHQRWRPVCGARCFAGLHVQCCMCYVSASAAYIPTPPGLDFASMRAYQTCLLIAFPKHSLLATL